MFRLVAIALWLSVLPLTAEDGAGYFRDKVQPLFARRCTSCHNDALRFSAFSLDSAEGLKNGGLHGPVVKAGDPAASRMYRRVARLEKPYMPMDGDPLTDDEVAVIRKWIELGTPWPEDPNARKAANSEQARLEAMKALENRRVITDKDRQWWSFQKPVRLAVPTPKAKPASANPIDAFILARLEEKGLKPAPAASKRTLVRRLYFDLIGLPPRPEEVEAFLADASADAWPKLIDRLLDSERYGERWGRHWLDVARYADSDGYEYDMLRPYSWRYRDYVIRAFNQDKPYDRFIREQVAGDELPDRDYDSLTALGFLRNGPFIGDMVLMQNEQTRQDELDDIVSTTGSAFLGLTVGCARCHDHKFDPILQRDYYRMVAVFAPGLRKDLPLAPQSLVEKHDAAVKQVDDSIDALKLEIKQIEKPVRERLLAAKYKKLPEDIQLALQTDPAKRTEAQKLQADQALHSVGVPESEILPELPPEDRKRVETLTAEIKDLEKTQPPDLPLAQGVMENGPEPAPSYFLHRGSIQSKGSRMSPGTVTVLNAAGVEPPFPAPGPDAKSSGRRTALANWLASADNPLTARVMVNRIWQHHFGRGLVGTPNDFGHMGERPSNLELLDWLATEFVRRGWSVKSMHRLILTSRTWQQAAGWPNAETAAIDPENRYLWKMPLLRLEGEIVRDNILSVAGSLNLKAGGPGVFPEVDAEILKGAAYQRWPKTTDGPEHWRRSVYVTEMRSITAPILDLFDPPENIGSCARRNVTTIAPQALQLLNNRFVAGQAAIFADRLRNELGRDRKAMVDRAFRLAYSRPPDPVELDRALGFLAAQEQYHREHNPELFATGADPAEVLPPDRAALVDFCHSLFNTNEFVYVN